MSDSSTPRRPTYLSFCSPKPHDSTLPAFRRGDPCGRPQSTIIVRINPIVRRQTRADIIRPYTYYHATANRRDTFLPFSPLNP